jgi:hypothetical protein
MYPSSPRVSRGKAGIRCHDCQCDGRQNGTNKPESKLPRCALGDHCTRTPLCSTTSAPPWSSTRQPGSSDTQVRACAAPGGPRFAIFTPSASTKRSSPSLTISTVGPMMKTRLGIDSARRDMPFALFALVVRPTNQPTTSGSFLLRVGNLSSDCRALQMLGECLRHRPCQRDCDRLRI